MVRKSSSGITIKGKGIFKEGNIEKNDTELTFYYTKDHLGNIREMTDYAGIVRARYEYDPWGRTQQLEGDLVAELGYTGHYRHLKSGLYLAPFRAYDPNQGRWLNRDPIEEEGGVNMYAYVRNRVNNAFDSSGLIPTILKFVRLLQSAGGSAINGILALLSALGFFDCDSMCKEKCRTCAFIKYALGLVGLIGGTIAVLAGCGAFTASGVGLPIGVGCGLLVGIGVAASIIGLNLVFAKTLRDCEDNLCC